MRIYLLRLTMFLTLLLSVDGTGCYAQSSAPQGTPMRSDWRPGVRYTTGTYTVRGWEKQQVGGNPNVGHWNWSPTIGYTQSGATGTSKQANTAPMPERTSVYIKPNHLPMPASIPKPTTAQVEAVDGSSSNHAETHTQAVLSYGGDYHTSDACRAESNVPGPLAHRSVGAILSQSLHY